MTQTSAQISDRLARFFRGEIANEQDMRRETGMPGSTEYEVASRDPDDDLYVPDASLAIALDSWRQGGEDVFLDYVPAADRKAAARALEAELDALIAADGPDALLEDYLS